LCAELVPNWSSLLRIPCAHCSPLPAFSELLEEILVTADNGSKREIYKAIKGFCGSFKCRCRSISQPQMVFSARLLYITGTRPITE